MVESGPLCCVGDFRVECLAVWMFLCTFVTNKILVAYEIPYWCTVF